jgi:hypothetical protein
MEDWAGSDIRVLARIKEARMVAMAVVDLAADMEDTTTVDGGRIIAASTRM